MISAIGLPKSSVARLASWRRKYSRVLDVRFDSMYAHLPSAGEQRPAVREHDRVVVHVADPAFYRTA
jgi:hypothetical protein